MRSFNVFFSHYARQQHQASPLVKKSTTNVNSYNVDSVADAVSMVSSSSMQMANAVSLLADPKVAAAVGAGVVAILGFFGASMNSGKAGGEKKKAVAVAEPEPEPIDVSIPYDSAARLAFCQTMGIKEADIDEAKFQQYKTLYLEATSAAMAAKQKARNLAQMFPTAN
jgi:hypothetical protein